MEHKLYEGLALLVLAAHLAWIIWVIGGCLVTRHRPVLRWLHIASLIYGIAIEVGPWYCPLTLLEQELLDRAGMSHYSNDFIVHYLQTVIYPDVSPMLLAWLGSVVCLFNLGVYGWQFWRRSWSRV